MRILLAVVLVAHGVAHLVGFVVPWKLLTSAEVPYRTTVLAGTFDLGPTGVRLLGIVWLALAIAFAVIGGGLLLGASWWYRAALVTVPVSFLLCILGWPDSRVGVFANGVILSVLVAGVRRGW